MIRPTPGTPSKGKESGGPDGFLKDLSLKWDLQIRLPQYKESPSKRRAVADVKGESVVENIRTKINFLWYKGKDDLDAAIKQFEQQARGLQGSWMINSESGHDVLPMSRGSSTVKLTAEQRKAYHSILFECLLPAAEKTKIEMVRSRPLARSVSLGDASTANRKTHSGPDVIRMSEPPLLLGAKNSYGTKRKAVKLLGPIDEELKISDAQQVGRLSSPKIIDASDDVEASIHTKRSRTRVFKKSYSDASSNSISYVPENNIGFHDATDNLVHPKSTGPASTVRRSADSSFTSNVSTVFSNRSSNASFMSNTTAENSFMDTSFNKSMASSEVAGPETAESDFFGSSFEVPIELFESKIPHPPIARDTIQLHDTDVVNAVEELKYRLQDIFPPLPPVLEKASLRLRYEIMRVFLHTDVPIRELQINNPYRTLPGLVAYEDVWRFLKQQPALQGKSFPEKSSNDAWVASEKTFQHKGINVVVLSAKLRFNSSASGPFFQVYLQPLKLDLSCRLSRRFGSDRFLEIAIPSFRSKKIPVLLQRARNAGHQAIVSWIVHGLHQFLGIVWKPFYVKDIDRKKVDIELTTTEELENAVVHRIHCFAIDGLGFHKGDKVAPKGEDLWCHTKMALSDMINWLIPLAENLDNPVLKLFSRISLGLSKTYSTVILKQTEIRYKKDLLSDDGKGSVMNDGCGQMSRKMALDISQMLNLSNTPSAFQGRIGGAKGLWIIDGHDLSDKIWIEIYPSQLKWKGNGSGIIFCDEAYRTFEVLHWSTPLRSAALNLQFLPVLEARGISQTAMRDAISQLLWNGLTYEIGRQRSAMDGIQSFRKWVRDNDSGIQDRIKNGEVLFKGGLPSSTSEKMNMLLDAGFDPKKLYFLKDLAWKSFSSKCEVLKTKLNIKVGLSAYVYMAVDFTGVLQPDEVHLGFSTNFQDERINYSEVLLSGIDVLVARSPAHYVSDIQRVKVVFRPELAVLKDVIIFSSKGSLPLAQKLSGGDYDGDKAWVCWEPSLVNMFQNANVPEVPDLVKLGYVKKNRANFSDLITKMPQDAIPAFLEQGFSFNLRPNLLGICTNFKERYCYTTGNLGSYESTFLSTLLSSLVDQSKQGYTFDETDWRKIQSEIIRITPRIPKYKNKKLEGTASHIIDYLKFITAENATRDTLTDFHNSIKGATYWDADLVKYANFAKELAKSSTDWKVVIDKLEKDVYEVKKIWQVTCTGMGDADERNASFSVTLNEVYEKWLGIKPAVDSTLTQALNPTCFTDPELTPWALLKASIAFASYGRGFVGNFVWWMAGRQLAHLKALCGGEGRGMVSVIPQMYSMLKPDNTFVKLMQTGDKDPCFWEARAYNDMDGVEEMETE